VGHADRQPAVLAQTPRGVVDTAWQWDTLVRRAEAHAAGAALALAEARRRGAAALVGGGGGGAAVFPPLGGAAATPAASALPAGVAHAPAPPTGWSGGVVADSGIGSSGDGNGGMPALLATLFKSAAGQQPEPNEAAAALGAGNGQPHAASALAAEAGPATAPALAAAPSLGAWGTGEAAAPDPFALAGGAGLGSVWSWRL
jgi:hypothetical protein